MELIKLNNSQTQITASAERLDYLENILRVERDGWQFDYMVKIGRRSKYETFFNRVSPEIMVIDNGFLELPPIRDALGLPELPTPPDVELAEFVCSLDLPFPPYDYQLKAAEYALGKEVALPIMCTGSGKSLTISLILEYFRQRKLRGVLVVPNINLLTQFANDIKSYNLIELHSDIIKAGGGNKFEGFPNGKTVLITTWQTLMKQTEILKDIDFIICDEVHRFSSECTSMLVRSTTNARYKLGFTGTLPGNKAAKMTILGLFGMPKVFVTSADLIKAGRGTPIKIHGIKLVHPTESCEEVDRYFEYLDRVKFIAGDSSRNALIARMAKKLAGNGVGSTLVLYTLVEHGLAIYKEICGEGPGNFERQEELRCFFMDGSVKGKDRERIRVAMDKYPDAILVANYALLSTGVNIKSLRYAIFASPLKSYTSIVQSLGRGIRTSSGKEVFEVYDLIDHFPGSRKRSFLNSSKKRKDIYESQQFEYQERKIML